MEKIKVTRYNWVEEDDVVEGFKFEVDGYTNIFVVHERNTHCKIWDVTESKSGLRFPYKEDRSQEVFTKTIQEAIENAKDLLATANQQLFDRMIADKLAYQNSLYPNQISL